MNEPQILSLIHDEALAHLEAEARALLARPGRHVLGIAGGPGVGKSTLATALVARLGAGAAYLPMDGFHMKQAKLEALGTSADKGMPHTFEGAAFAEFLARAKAATGAIQAPAYSRQIEDVIDDAIDIPATARLLVAEGNYLLLSSSPWWAVRPLLDRAVFVEVSRELVEARLLKRHAEAGLFTEERNRAHIARVDLPNYDLVTRSKGQADVVIRLLTES
jgi:pantothenate kinase